MTNGETVHVPTFEYEHPAAQEANASTSEFDGLQGSLGRPRAMNRTADDPVVTVHVGSAPLPGNPVVDVLIRHAEDLAPDRFLCMMAEYAAVDSPVDRCRLFGGIYKKPWHAKYDRKFEAGGFFATVMRVLCPPWGGGPRESWVTGRYWKSGHGRRTAGEKFVCATRQLDVFMRTLRATVGATDIVVDREIKPELGINRQNREEAAILPSSPDAAPRPGPDAGFARPDSVWRVEHPPDG